MPTEPAATLRTARLVLRPLAMTDVDAIAEALSDWDVVKTLTLPPWPYRREDAVERVQTAAAGAGEARARIFALALAAAPERLIGMSSLAPERTGGDTHIGFWLARPYWGQGLMTEAAAELLRLGFEDWGLARIGSACFLDNPASMRLHEKLGFRVLGQSRLYCRPRECEVSSADLMLDRANWAAAQARGATL